MVQADRIATYRPRSVNSLLILFKAMVSEVVGCVCEREFVRAEAGDEGIWRAVKSAEERCCGLVVEVGERCQRETAP